MCSAIKPRPCTIMHSLFKGYTIICVECTRKVLAIYSIGLPTRLQEIAISRPNCLIVSNVEKFVANLIFIRSLVETILPPIMPVHIN